MKLKHQKGYNFGKNRGKVHAKADKRLSKISKKDYSKNYRYFKTTLNREVYTSERRLKNFRYMFIRVKVRVYLNKSRSASVVSTARSDLIPRRISLEERLFYTRQAVMRALAPFGSDLGFDFISIQYGYFQEEF